MYPHSNSLYSVPGASNKDLTPSEGDSLTIKFGRAKLGEACHWRPEREPGDNLLAMFDFTTGEIVDIRRL